MVTTTNVMVFHNIEKDEAGRHVGWTDGYADWHELQYVATIAAPTDPDPRVTLEWVYRAMNLVDGTEPVIELKCRSLSVGDVVALGEAWYHVASIGWRQCEKFPDVELPTEQRFVTWEPADV